MGAVIEVESLRKSYGDVERLHGVSFEVGDGEIFGLIGVNGAGKSTTIEILEGYRSRNAGSVRVLGTDPAHADRRWRNQIGLVLQECDLDPIYTVEETVTMFARYFVSPTGVASTIEAVGLAGQATTRIGRLSGGQRRRLDVALGLIGDPKVLFLDEPTTGLDPSARRGMWATLQELRDAGKTIFLTTHYMDEAAHLADRIVILRAGDIVAHGTPEELSRTMGAGSIVRCEVPRWVTSDHLDALVDVPTQVADGVVRFKTDDAQRSLTALLGWADRERVTLGHLQVIQPTLDDVFIELAGTEDLEPDPMGAP